MCAGAVVLARVARVVFGAWDDKAGMAGSVEDLLRHPRLNHRPEVAAGVLAEECGEVLSAFFVARRGERGERERGGPEDAGGVGDARGARARRVDTPPASG